MLGARLIVLPIVLPWTFSLIASLPIEAAEQTAIPQTNSAKAVAAEPIDASKKAVSPTPSAIQKAPDSKTTATAQTAKPRASAQAATPAGKAQEEKQTAPPAKSPSILQMLEGHETEFAIAVAIAVAFFFIGWICGGNYYLRRDRRWRRKIRF
jgi:hypothetical protein